MASPRFSSVHTAARAFEVAAEIRAVTSSSGGGSSGARRLLTAGSNTTQLQIIGASLVVPNMTVTAGIITSTLLHTNVVFILGADVSLCLHADGSVSAASLNVDGAVATTQITLQASGANESLTLTSSGVNISGKDFTLENINASRLAIVSSAPTLSLLTSNGSHVLRDAGDGILRLLRRRGLLCSNEQYLAW